MLCLVTEHDASRNPVEFEEDIYREGNAVLVLVKPVCFLKY